MAAYSVRQCTLPRLQCMLTHLLVLVQIMTSAVTEMQRIRMKTTAMALPPATAPTLTRLPAASELFPPPVPDSVAAGT